jgi:CheY-like chemotaxis protein
VKAFQDLVRTRRGGPADVAPARLVADALALAAQPLQEVAVSVAVPDDLPPVRGEPADLRQALLAVLVHVLDGLGWPAARGALHVEGRAAGERVELVVESSASADAADALDVRVAEELLRGIGGGLRIDAAATGGERFVLELPVVVALAVPTPDASPVSTPAGPASAVLVCDDDESIRRLIVRVLRRDGVEAIGAATGDEALGLLVERPLGYVVADHHLAGMSGLRPALRGRFVLVSGDAGDAELVDFATAEGLRVVEKPFDVNALAALVREAATA